MHHFETGFDIWLRDNILLFEGNFEQSDYTKVDQFLRAFDETFKEAHCVIDLTQVEYFNSSGIKSLATFMLGSPKSFEIRLNQDNLWQQESIWPLTFLKPQGITISEGPGKG